MQVDNDAKVTVCLKEVSAEGVRFAMSASLDTDVTVSLLTQSGAWGLTQLENGDWLIAKGDQAPQDGKVSFRIQLKERKSKEYPKEFGARLMLTDSTNLYVQTQDPIITDYCYYKEFPLSADVKLYRGIHGTDQAELKPCSVIDLQLGDYVQVKLNDRGRVEEVYAWYGQITGTVVAVEEMSLFGTVSNPFVTVRTDDGTTLRLEIGYETLLHFTGATGEMGKLALVEAVGLTVGQKITVTYCPYEWEGRIRAIEIRD